MKKIIASLPLLLLPVVAFAWSTPYNISKNNTSITAIADISIAVDKDGKTHVVWEAWRSDNYWGPHWIMYSSGMDTNWSTPVWLSGDTPSVSSASPNIVIDKNGRPFVGWSDETKGQIYYTYQNSGAWTTPQPIGNGFYGTRMAVDSQNNIHAVWHGGDYTVWYCKWNWTTWSVPYQLEADSSIDKAWPDIAIDSKGNIHVVAMEYRLSQGDPLTYFINDGTGWSKQPNPPDPSTSNSCYPRISIGLDDTIHLVWEERDTGYTGYYTCGKNNLWTTPRVLHDSFNAFSPQVVAVYNNIYCFWNAANDTGIGIYYAKRDSSSSWSTPEPLIKNRYTGAVCASLNNSAKMFSVAWRNSSTVVYSWDTVYLGGMLPPQDTGIHWPPVLILKYAPNPTRNKIKLTYEVRISGFIRLNVYNLVGRQVFVSDIGYKTKGPHVYEYYPDSSLASGVYFCQIVMKDVAYKTPLIKITLIK
ncbi:T9SS type A sorting domain-containing protein [candidate division TA06 bacterium]|uniref:T9SS type A sorting domain-containing protein n=1 Tax=candidate division TA06 bacterium TaxID=2250710 RepID=A0A933ICA4_UNCT6|nr:T9SS type A sorting domain-containing protein [candidate division TA06 bacterium]